MTDIQRTITGLSSADRQRTFLGLPMVNQVNSTYKVDVSTLQSSRIPLISLDDHLMVDLSWFVHFSYQSWAWPRWRCHHYGELLIPQMVWWCVAGLPGLPDVSLYSLTWFPQQGRPPTSSKTQIVLECLIVSNFRGRHVKGVGQFIVSFSGSSHTSPSSWKHQECRSVASHQTLALRHIFAPPKEL